MERGLENGVSRAGEVIAAARTQGSPYHEGNALNLRGWARYGTGDTLNALQDQLAAVDILNSCGDEKGVGRCLHALGAIYDTIGEPSVAIEHYEQALEIQMKIGDKWGEARTRNGLAVSVAQDNHYEQAAAAFLEVAQLFEAIGDRWWVLMARLNRCVTLLEQIQAGALSDEEANAVGEEVLEHCDAAIAESFDLGQAGVSVELYARHCRAGVLNELGDPRAALAEFDACLPLATRAGDVTILVDLEMHAARAEEALGETAGVMQRLDRAEELARNAGRDRHLTRTLELRATICEERGDLVEAVAALRQLYQQKTRARRQAEKMRAKVIRSLLNTQQAEYDLALARAEVESLGAIEEERRRMVSVIAHELRNPITTVLGLSSEIWRSWDELGKDGRELVAMIRDEAEDLANIVEDLLVAESIDQGSLQVEIQPCDLAPLTLSVLEAIVRDRSDVPVFGAAAALADQTRFRQILRNLITNAIRYGGDEINVALGVDSDGAYVEVRDDGDGVLEHEVDAIFEPYRRSTKDHHSARSVGLGLAVTRQLARLLNGDVTYRREGDETVFRLTLPAA